MGSSRLRGKSLMPVAGIPLLQLVVEMVQSIDFIGEVMVATTVLDEDGPIEAMSLQLGAKVFRGSATNLLERYYEASLDMNEEDIVVRFTADNLWNNIALTRRLFDLHVDNRNDYTHIDGLSHIVAEFIGVRALREAARHPNLNPFDKEHVTPFFRRRRDLFKVQTLAPSFGGLRHDLDKYLTIDTLDDLHRAEDIIKDLGINGNPPDFAQIYAYLDHHISGLAEQEATPVLNLAGVPVGKGYPAYIVAEIGQNHNGDIRLAKKLIDMAVECGASAVKFQKRDIASELTKEAFEKPYDNPNSFGKTYGEHRMFLELDEEEHLELKEYANARGITYFCTPCDVPSVELLERIGCPFYKVASRDLTNIPLLEALQQTGKPVIISTGMADLKDIDEAIKALKPSADKFAILQCTSEYPCALENVNLRAIETLQKIYGYVTGFSDHTSGIVTSVAAVVLGAAIIEKHITLNRTMKGTDQPGSLERAGLQKLVDYIRATELAMGDGVKAVNPATEAAKVKLARSITSAVDIKKGTVLTEEMLCLKSPGDGLKWIDRKRLIGKTANRDIAADVTLREDYFE